MIKLIELLKSWHWLHTWTKWGNGETLNSFLDNQLQNTGTMQFRHCMVCGKLERRVEWVK